MKKFVLDCSVAGAWFFKDEATAELYELQNRTRQGEAIVPALWYFEMANVLRKSEKKGRLSAEGVDEVHLVVIEGLPLEVDHLLPVNLTRRILPLARAHDLTAHDAAYLELALRRGVPLASKDKELRVAAGKLGIPVLPE